MDLDQGVCAGCSKPLGIRANWRMANGGRAYHKDCEPLPEPEETERRKESLTEHVERAARSALYGKGQRTLDQESPEK